MSAIEFSPEELAAFREELFNGFTDAQFNLAIAECRRRNFVPGQHVVFQLRSQRQWDATVGAAVFTKKMVKVTTIDAFRLISQRTGEYVGQGKAKFYYLDGSNQPTIISEVPLPDPKKPATPLSPWAASIPIYRKGFSEPVEVVCRFDAYAVTKDGKPTEVWSRRGPEMLSKCSEAAARRAAFPEELGSMYLSEEFDKEDSDARPDNPPAAPDPVAEAPKATVIPKVNHEPVQATAEPRPNEKRPEPEQKPKKLAKDVTLTEIVLDKVEAVSGVAPTVQETNNPKDPTERIRDLIAKGAPKDPLKAYLLAKSGKNTIKEIADSWWKTTLTKLENMSKEELITEVTKKASAPEVTKEEEPF